MEAVIKDIVSNSGGKEWADLRPVGKAWARRKTDSGQPFNRSWFLRSQITTRPHVCEAQGIKGVVIHRPATHKFQKTKLMPARFQVVSGKLITSQSRGIISKNYVIFRIYADFYVDKYPRNYQRPKLSIYAVSSLYNIYTLFRKNTWIFVELQYS